MPATCPLASHASHGQLRRRPRRTTAPPTLLRSSLAVAATTVLISGCGCGGGSATTLSAAELQTQLTAVADALDRCVATSNDARKCTKAGALRALPAGITLGDGTGQIDVKATKPLRYQLTTETARGNRFAILAQPVGARKRVCTAPGHDDCAKGGTW